MAKNSSVHLNPVCKMKVEVLLAFVLVLALAGCPGRQQTKGVMEIKELGFSMKLPSGWKQGRPTVKRGKKYKAEQGGHYCFESETEGYPFGSVMNLSFEGWTSLDEFVSNPMCFHGRLLSKTYRDVSGFEAIEIVGEGFGEKRKPVKGMHLYVQKGNQVILISFRSLKQDFEEYEPQFRECLNSVRIAEEQAVPGE
ncbi:hypothetical protein CH330_03860 [candidate division WOR-3 bacterium JGI_Cruoil_03_51_56]|uniref:DUF1795 domain-containing protein n=1 Tax=candidate division WOR-3 bacterium JGI_Cruoil_03_51_56 TaxID=1973747 RepID=A0A235BUY7_UNCW3|nr:MAG: hypothetical protein CH330_03860 [candidate division WOR-3 bacterium JGI_Cruoil_03_51_56]